MSSSSSMDDDLRAEYDESLFANGTRGKHATAYQADTNLVRLAPSLPPSTFEEGDGPA